VISTLGRYHVERLLGVGSFAAVYLAHDPALDGPVALKVLADHFSGVPEVRERFVQEARLLRRLGRQAGPAGRLVTIHDIAEESGQPYLVMEYLPRGSLQQRLVPGAGLVLADSSLADSSPADSSPADALRRLSAELESCLAIIHAQGVTHRDIKPSNLLIRGTRTPAVDREDGRPGGADSDSDTGSDAPARSRLLDDDEVLVLADFGLARGEDQTHVTLAAGTPGFSPPEQLIASASVDPRADLYAATVVVIAAAVGRPASLSELRGQLNDHTAQASLARCLAVAPTDRPPDAASWHEEISRAMPALARAGGADPLVSGTASVRRRPAKGLRWARSGKWVAGGLLATALIGGGVKLGSPPDDVPPDPAGGHPQIIGPETLLVGEPATYRHEDRPGVTFQWTGPDGQVSGASSLTVVPTSSADLVVTLTEDDGDQRRSSTLTIRVRTR
jgi:serine/threonine protein kinase